MTSPPPPNPNQPFAQGQQGNVQGSDGSIIDDVGSAVGDAAGSVAGAAGDAVSSVVGAAGLSGLTGLFESIASGLAHTVNVILNNMFYAGLCTLGAILMVAGFVMLINATPAGDAFKGGIGSAVGIAAKVLPI